MEKLKIEGVVSAEVRVSNADTTDRKADISAVVRIDNNMASSVNDGSVIKDGNVVATFSTWSEEQLNIDFQSAELQRTAVLAEVEAFITKVRTNPEAIMTTAAE